MVVLNLQMKNNMSKYQWKMQGLFKVDANVAMHELTRIKTEVGALTPEIIVAAASDADSPLHALFEWDDEAAAKKWRIYQARIILNNIEVKVLHNGEEKEVSVFEITTSNGREYKSIDTFNAEDISNIIRKTKMEINALKNKLSTYNQFESVVVKLSEAEDELSNYVEADTLGSGTIGAER